jgi:hypothetical protein
MLELHTYYSLDKRNLEWWNAFFDLQKYATYSCLSIGLWVLAKKCTFFHDVGCPFVIQLEYFQKTCINGDWKPSSQCPHHDNNKEYQSTSNKMW